MTPDLTPFDFTNLITLLKTDVVNGFVCLMILHLMCLTFSSIAVLLITNMILSEILRSLPYISFQKKIRYLHSCFKNRNLSHVVKKLFSLTLNILLCI